MNEEPARGSGEGWTEYRPDPARAGLQATLDGLLRPAGFRVDAVLTLGAPLQVVGRLPTGERFLFHERHERVAMDLWNPGTKVEDIPPPEHELTWTEETDISTSHEAGLTTDGIADLIRSAFDRYSQEASRR